MNNNWIVRILALEPAPEMSEWLLNLPANTSPQTAWDACERGNWMIWLLDKTGNLTSRQAVEVGVKIVRLPEVWVLLTDERSRKAVETVEAWLRGEEVDLEEAARGALRATWSTWVAVYAARAARSAVWAAEAAAWAWAALAANGVAVNAARATGNPRLIADTVREMFPTCPTI